MSINRPLPDTMKEKKKPSRLFKYAPDIIEGSLNKIADECQKDMQEQFAIANMRQFIRSFEAGYLQALVDYGIISQQDADNV